MTISDFDFQLFWAGIAQVVPVVALALVLEARLLAPGLASKKEFKKRRRRVLWGMRYYLLGVLLLMLEFRAVSGMAVVSEQQTGGTTAGYVVLALVVVPWAMIEVLTLPLLRLARATSGDAMASLRAKLPWALPQRRRRQWLELIREAEQLARDIEDDMHGILMRVSSMRVVNLQVERLLRDIDHRSSVDGIEPAAIDQLRTHARETPKFEAMLDAQMRLYEEGKDRVASIRNGVQKTRKALRKLEKAIDRGGYNAALKQHRKVLARAAQAWVA